MRVVFDANIYISFFLTRGPTITSIFSYWEKDCFSVLISPIIIEEIETAFQYSRIKERLKAKDFLNLYLLLEEAEMIYPHSKVGIIKDLKDNMYLECAQDGSADYLITGDKKHLLPLKKFGRTKIISPREFVAEIGRDCRDIMKTCPMSF